MAAEVDGLVQWWNGKRVANNELFNSTRVFHCSGDCPEGTIPSSRAYIPFVTPLLFPLRPPN